MYDQHKIVAALLLLSYLGFYVDANKCVFPIESKGNIRNRWPLVFTPTGELYEASKNADDANQVEVPTGAKALISCGPNYLKNYRRTEQLEVSCNGETGNFSITKRNRVEPATELTCDLRVIEEVIGDVAGCENPAWTAVKFGFVHPVSQKARIVGEACYDESEGRTIFAHVKLGKASDYLEELDKTYLTRHSHPNGRYKIEFFRGLNFDEIYEHYHLELAQSPLMNMTNFIGDTLLGHLQYQEVKKLGWNYVVVYEDLSLLDYLRKDINEFSNTNTLEVYMGSLGVCTVGANSGKEIYLHPLTRKYPMPKYIWFLVSNGGRVTGFAVKNKSKNNLLSENFQELSPCKTDCNQISWLKLAEDQPELVCCSYEELKKMVPELPLMANVAGLLI